MGKWFSKNTGRIRSTPYKTALGRAMILNVT